MLDLLNTIVQWIITGLNNVFNLIASIPKYVTTIFNWYTLIPNFMTPFIVCGLSAVIIIKIKRLII